MTDADIKSYACIFGGHNPIHVSDTYAQQSIYRKRIVHGMISSSFFQSFLVPSYQDTDVYMYLRH
ncbi:MULTISPECIES: MaoC family dehydratase [Citrobacter]|uniref:MaoC family dehydratase n=1 Tax=Citrobacter TaxID=544 RepID=UPI001CC2DB54